jgi:AcrR family transcriptional regulator
VLLVEQGYRSTTVAAVARAAGVNVDTVYELVGRKPVIVRMLIEMAISGADSAVPAEERDYVRRIRALHEAHAKLTEYATAMAGIQIRMAPLFLALREAAATDSSAQQIWSDIADRRAANMRLLAADLRAAGGVRDDLTDVEIADIIWATNSPELYVLLTKDRGWTPEQYGRWLADAWHRQLLSFPPAADARSR